MNIIESQGRYTFYNRVTILNKLRPGNYFLDFDIFGTFIREGEPFTFPAKLYDVEKSFRDIIFKSHKSSPKNTGVCLEGYKGTGKTNTAKLLCVESGLPVIIIDKKIPTKIDFKAFLQSIEQDIVVFIDEFEKLFGSNLDDANETYHDQDSFLGLMDGVNACPSKRLWLLTSNEIIDDKFINRPSRVRFYKKYNYMHVDLYHMIVNDLLKFPAFKKDLIEQLPVSDATVDLLTSIIKEINNLEIPYSQFRDIFNHKPRYIEYNLSVFYKNDFVELGNVDISHCPDMTDTYICGMSINKIINANKEEFIFESPHVHNLYRVKMKIKNEDAEKPIIYRLNRKALTYIDL